MQNPASFIGSSSPKRSKLSAYQARKPQPIDTKNDPQSAYT